jgi:hypothetical protein
MGLSLVYDVISKDKGNKTTKMVFASVNLSKNNGEHSLIGLILPANQGVSHPY